MSKSKETDSAPSALESAQDDSAAQLAPQPGFGEVAQGLNPTAVAPPSYSEAIASTSAVAGRERSRSIWVLVAVAIGLQVAGAAVVVMRRRAAPPAPTPVVTTKPDKVEARPAETSDPLAWYRRAKQLAASGKYLEAMDAIARVRALVEDEDLVRLVDDLEQRIRATPRLKEAKRLIENKQFRAAVYHLDGLLTSYPGQPEALALRAKADKLAGPELSAQASKKGAPAATSRRSRTARRTRGRRGASAAARGKAGRPAPALRPARLTVRSTPSAMAYVNGELAGPTPLLALKLEPGKHVVELTRKGMQSYKNTITLSAEERRSLDIQMRGVEPGVGEPAAVTASAAGASVLPPASETAPKKQVAQQAPPAVAKRKKKPTAIPKLALPAKVSVRVYRTDRMGVALRALPMVGTICRAVEQTVTKAIGRSAAGTTRALRDHIYESYRDSADQVTTLYPRKIGTVVAKALINNERGIGAKLVRHYKNGLLAQGR